MGQRFRDVDATLRFDGRRRRAAFWDAILAVSSFEFGTGAGFCGRRLVHGVHGSV